MILPPIEVPLDAWAPPPAGWVIAVLHPDRPRWWCGPEHELGGSVWTDRYAGAASWPTRRDAEAALANCTSPSAARATVCEASA